MLRKMFAEVSASLLVLLFGYTAVAKLLNYATTVNQMKASPVFFLSSHASLWAWLVPAVELVVCLLLVWPKFSRTGLMVSVVLLTMFSIYIIWVLQQGERIPCSCGGVIAAMSWHGHLVFNGVFILIGFCGLFIKEYTARPEALDRVNNN